MKESIKREIRKKADLFREKCKVRRYGIVDLFKECERCGYKIIRYPLGDNADLGFVLKKDNDIIIFTNTSSRLSREIFTLAHEIGHVVLHQNSNMHFVDDKITIAGRCNDEIEQEANYFAACLLMPAEEVNRFFDFELPHFKNENLSAMDIARMMSEFNVSFEMVLNRLENLEKIDASARLILDTEKNKLRVSNLLKSVGGNARLNCSSNEIDLPYEYLECVIYNYNHNAIPKETLERVLLYYKLSLEDISDRLVEHTEINDDLENLIGGL